MPLTVESALQAGQLATAINYLTAQQTELQSMVKSGLPILAFSVQTSGLEVTGNFQLNPADSATVLNAVISVISANIATLNTQLASF